MITLLTGGTGFLGREIAKRSDIGIIKTLGRSESDYCVDLAKEIPQLEDIELVIHCAGKAHMVPKSEKERAEFFEVNVKGTENLLIALSNMGNPLREFVLISSVAVYGKEAANNINEETPLEAVDPYGKSKIQKEELVKDWCYKNKVTCTILRLPLLVGTNAPGNLGAMIRGIEKGYYFNIAGGHAKKSMVLAKDVAAIINVVASIGGTYNLTDGYHPNFSELSEAIAKQLGKPKPRNLPNWLATFIAGLGDIIGQRSPISSKKLKKITSDLTFDDTKAKKTFGWKPERVLERFSIIKSN